MSSIKSRPQWVKLIHVNYNQSLVSLVVSYVGILFTSNVRFSVRLTNKRTNTQTDRMKHYYLAIVGKTNMCPYLGYILWLWYPSIHHDDVMAWTYFAHYWTLCHACILTQVKYHFGKENTCITLNGSPMCLPIAFHVSCILENKIQWNFNQQTMIFIEGSACENVCIQFNTQLPHSTLKLNTKTLAHM